MKEFTRQIAVHTILVNVTIIGEREMPGSTGLPVP